MDRGLTLGPGFHFFGVPRSISSRGGDFATGRQAAARNQLDCRSTGDRSHLLWPIMLESRETVPALSSNRWLSRTSARSGVGRSRGHNQPKHPFDLQPPRAGAAISA
jgi:hypothetical protein